jgi:hypothetical protein
MHAHFGRPGASAGLLMVMLRKSEKVADIVRETFDVPKPVFEQVDLLQPLDVFVLEAEGTTHQLALFGASPSAQEELEAQFQLDIVSRGYFRIR